MNKIGFFEEAPGQSSITRVAFFMMIVNALFVLNYQLITTGHIDVAAFLSMVGAACGLKLWQKGQEIKAANQSA
jgi:hypothetical protein